MIKQIGLEYEWLSPITGEILSKHGYLFGPKCADEKICWRPFRDGNSTVIFYSKNKEDLEKFRDFTLGEFNEIL